MFILIIGTNDVVFMVDLGFAVEHLRGFEGQFAPRHQAIKRHGAIRGCMSPLRGGPDALSDSPSIPGFAGLRLCYGERR